MTRVRVLADDWMQRRARLLATDAEAMLTKHERKEHDGARCQIERIGFVAFMAHRLGVRDPASIELLVELIGEYEVTHHEHGR